MGTSQHVFLVRYRLAWGIMEFVRVATLVEKIDVTPLSIYPENTRAGSAFTEYRLLVLRDERWHSLVLSEKEINAAFPGDTFMHGMLGSVEGNVCMAPAK